MIEQIRCEKCCFRTKRHCHKWNIQIDNIYQNGCGDGIDLSQTEGGDKDELP